MIPLKSKKDLEIMRQAGRTLAGIMLKIQSNISIGISMAQINRLTEELIRQNNVTSAFKGYKGFPADICISVNEEVVHGIPGERQLKEGDIVSLDLGINFAGYFSDTAITLPVGKVNKQLRKLIEVTKRALSEGIKKAQENNRVSDISSAIQRYVESQRFSVVRQFVGHGIGRDLHEEPEVPNFGQPHQGEVLKAGMVLAIEPMVNLGTWECEILADGWTAVTKDRLASAHFEHTVAITEEGPEILTQVAGYG